MKKSELIEQLNKIPGDYIVTFPNMEYGGYEEIRTVQIVKSHPITEEGRENYLETGADFSDDSRADRVEDLYAKEECKIIVICI